MLTLLAAMAGGVFSLRTPLIPRCATTLRSRVGILRLSDEAADSSGGVVDEVFADDSGLITIASLKGESLELLESELNKRNKERFLEGKEQYDSIEAMVDEYVNYEGKDADMSREQCEDAVLRYLQRRALLSEGADGLTDPQTLLSLVLLGALLIGVVGVCFALSHTSSPA